MKILMTRLSLINRVLSRCNYMPWGTLPHPLLFCSHSPPLLHRYWAIWLLALAMADWIISRPWKAGGIGKLVHQLAKHLQFIFRLEKDEQGQLGFHSWESELRHIEKIPSQWWVLVWKGQVSPGKEATLPKFWGVQYQRKPAGREENRMFPKTELMVLEGNRILYFWRPGSSAFPGFLWNFFMFSDYPFSPRLFTRISWHPLLQFKPGY